MQTSRTYTNESSYARTASVPVVPGKTTIDCVRHLDPELLAHWRAARQQNQELANGCFHEEFSLAVSRVRADVEYGIISNSNQVIGVLPFQRVGRTLANPVGGMMNDFHGLIAFRPPQLTHAEFLRKTSLRRFNFHALAQDISHQPSSSTKRIYRTLNCPHIDLSAGTFEYQNWLLKHSSTVRRQPQKTRALERKFGPVHLEADCRDARVLEDLIRWKRAKFQRTRTFDILKLEWTSNLIRELFQSRTEDFRGMLSVLWAGDKPVAAHFGFETSGVLHYWFPAQNHEYGRYSPGTQLMKELTGQASEHGIRRIDLGYGESPLKDRFANGSTIVECGCIAKNFLVRGLCHSRFEFRQALKRIPLKEPLKKVVRPLHPNLGKNKFR